MKQQKTTCRIAYESMFPLRFQRGVCGVKTARLYLVCYMVDEEDGHVAMVWNVEGLVDTAGPIDHSNFRDRVAATEREIEKRLRQHLTGPKDISCDFGFRADGSHGLEVEVHIRDGRDHPGGLGTMPDSIFKERIYWGYSREIARQL